MAINQSVIVGRLTRDPELKTTGSGFPFVNFCVAVDRPYKSGEEKQCDFIDCTAWRSSAEFLAKWFRKGSPIGIVGHIQTRNFQTQDGQKRKSTEIVVDNISFVGSSGGGNQNDAAPYVEPGCNAAPAAPASVPGYGSPAPAPGPGPVAPGYGAPGMPYGYGYGVNPAAPGPGPAPAAAPGFAPPGGSYGSPAPGAFYNSRPVHPQAVVDMVPAQEPGPEAGNVVTDFAVMVEPVSDDDLPF